MFSYERKVFFNCDVINEKGSRSRYARIIARDDFHLFWLCVDTKAILSETLELPRFKKL